MEIEYLASLAVLHEKYVAGHIDLQEYIQRRQVSCDAYQRDVQERTKVKMDWKAIPTSPPAHPYPGAVWCDVAANEYVYFITETGKWKRCFKEWVLREFSADE